MAKAAGARLLRGGAFKPRTSPYAFQGLGVKGLEILADVREATGLPIVTEVVDARDVEDRRRARRHAPDRHPQHGQLRPAPGGRRVRQAGAAQARDDLDHRGVADGGGVRRPARQPRHRALRARHPHLRAEHPQHPGHLGRARSCRRPATCRSSSTRPTRAGAATSSYPCRGRPSPSAPTASSSTSTPTRRTRCATGPRPSSAPTSAPSPRPSASSRAAGRAPL